GAVVRVVGLGGVDELSVNGGPVHLLGQALQFVERGLERPRGAGVRLLDLAAIVALEFLSADESGLEVAADLWVFQARIEVIEVPGNTLGAARRLVHFLSRANRVWGVFCFVYVTFLATSDKGVGAYASWRLRRFRPAVKTRSGGTH